MEQAGTQVAAADSRPPLRINAFPTGPDLWRVDWFGSIAFPDRLARRQQPSVLVHLSKVLAAEELDGLSFGNASRATEPASRQVKCWVSVGTLVLLRIGDLWRDQMLVGTPAYRLQEFKALRVDASTLDLVKAGSSVGQGSFLLPLDEHPWHRNNTHSYCAHVELKDGRSLVIPCMELVRFYFGSSSELLSRLFTPPLQKERLFTAVKRDPSGWRMSVDLADRIPRASAADVARIAGSPVAWKAAALIGASCLQASTAGQEVFAKAVFPFEGETDLQATGMWLSRSHDPWQTFLVFRIHSCSHAFPFTSLRYRLSGLQKHLGRAASGGRPEGFRASAASPRRPSLHERDASSQLAPKTWMHLAEPRFPDLTRKTVWADRNLSAGSQSGRQLKAAAVDELAVGDPGSSARIRPVTLALSDALGQRDPPAFLRPVLEYLGTLTDVQVSVLSASDADGWTVPITLVPDEDGVIDPALLRVDETGSCPRRLTVFRVRSSTGQTILALVEWDQPVPIFYPEMPGDAPVDLDRLIQRAASDLVARLHRGSYIAGSRDVGASSNAIAFEDGEGSVHWLRQGFFSASDRR